MPNDAEARSSIDHVCNCRCVRRFRRAYLKCRLNRRAEIAVKIITGSSSRDRARFVPLLLILPSPTFPNAGSACRNQLDPGRLARADMHLPRDRSLPPSLLSTAPIGPRPRCRGERYWRDAAITDEPTHTVATATNRTAPGQDGTVSLGIRTVNPGFYSPGIEVYSVLRSPRRCASYPSRTCA